MFPRVVVVCECAHLKRVHLITKQKPNGPCTACECRAFTPEKQCDVPKCGHGRKAHRNGRCHECGCGHFRPKPQPKKGEPMFEEEAGLSEAAGLRATLSTFTGTIEYHPHWSGMRYTDGVRYLAESAKAYWLIDVIASWQPKALRDPWLREFQLWELFVRPDRTATAVCSRDSEDVAFRQEIEYTDFPLDYVKLYVEGGVLLLSSEH